METPNRGEKNPKGQVYPERDLNRQGAKGEKGEKKDSSGYWSLHQYFLGASVVSKAVKAGKAGFPSCTELEVVSCVILAVSQNPDKSVLSSRENPSTSNLCEVFQSAWTGSWSKKREFLFLPFLWSWAPRPFESPSDLCCLTEREPGTGMFGRANSQDLLGRCGVLMPMTCFQAHFQNQKIWRSLNKM